MREKAAALDREGLRVYVDLDRHGLSVFALKIIAVVTMVIDHTGYIFMNGRVTPVALDLPFFDVRFQINWMSVFRGIGRLSFPIFAFLIVEGFYHTKSRARYAARLFLFALLSEVPYDMAFSRVFFDPNQQNIFFTLLIGLLAIMALSGVSERGGNQDLSTGRFSKIRSAWYTRAFIMIAACAAGYIFKCTYSYAGVFLIISFYVFYRNHIGKALGNALFNIVLFGGMQSLGTFSVIPIAFYNGKKGRYSWKWFFYIFYPLHLLVLSALAKLIL